MKIESENVCITDADPHTDVRTLWKRTLRNGFSNSAQNLDSENIFKHFGLDGWLKVSYLLDY